MPVSVFVASLVDCVSFDQHLDFMLFQQFLKFLKIGGGWLGIRAGRLQIPLRRVVGEPHVAEQIVGHRFGGGVGDVLMRVAERPSCPFLFSSPACSTR